MRKFIIVANPVDVLKYYQKEIPKIPATLRLGDVAYHKDLLRNREIETCLGGGMYDITDEELYMYGESGDFGIPQFSTITLKCENEEDIRPIMIYSYKECLFPDDANDDIDVRSMIQD